MTTKLQHFDNLVRLVMLTDKPRKVDLDRLHRAIDCLCPPCSKHFANACFMIGCKRYDEASESIQKLLERIDTNYATGDFRARVADAYLKQDEDQS